MIPEGAWSRAVRGSLGEPQTSSRLPRQLQATGDCRRIGFRLNKGMTRAISIF